MALESHARGDIPSRRSPRGSEHGRCECTRIVDRTGRFDAGFGFFFAR